MSGVTKFQVVSYVSHTSCDVMSCHVTQVQGKVNAITLDSCSRTGLVFQDLVSSCEVVNCSSVEVQSTGIMPTIAIDKTDGIVVGSQPTWLCCASVPCVSCASSAIWPCTGAMLQIDLMLISKLILLPTLNCNKALDSSSTVWQETANPSTTKCTCVITFAESSWTSLWETAMCNYCLYSKRPETPILHHACMGETLDVLSQLLMQLYLSEGSLGVAITTAKSSAINVVVPGSGESDPIELPVPEQFVSTFRDGKLVTEAVMHSGA